MTWAGPLAGLEGWQIMEILISGYNRFPHIYEMIQHIAQGDIGKIRVPDSECTADFAAEAKEFITVLDRYMEITPDIPRMTKEKVYEAFTALEIHYGFVVWTNRMTGTDEDNALHILKNPGMATKESMVLSYKTCRESMEALRKGFMTAMPDIVIAKGYVESWSGTVHRELTMNDLSAVFELPIFDNMHSFHTKAYEGPFTTLFITTDGNLKIEYEHGNGDYKDEYTFYTADDESVVPALEKYFGWNHSLTPYAVCRHEGGQAFLPVDYRMYQGK